MRKIYIILLAFSALLLVSWGNQGHYSISYKSALFIPAEMQSILPWAQTLANHASDADIRKETDPNESPRHYIDIDNYPTFATQHRIPQSLDS